MSIFVVWDEPQKHIMHFVYRPAWTERDFEAALNRARARLTQVDHPVDIIIDHQQVHVEAQELLRHARRLTAMTRHTNARRVVLLGTGMPSAFRSLAKNTVHEDNPFSHFLFASTMDEAYDILGDATV